MLYIFITLAGLIFGSFASVIIHRLHTQEKGIFVGRSKCPYCAKHLGPLDLIPVLSYVINKAKCRFCKEPIAFRYPLLELSMGGLFLLTSYLVGTQDPLNLIFYLVITFVFVLLTFYDFLFKEVPDEISLPALLISILYMLIAGHLSWFSLLLGVMVPVFFFGALYFGSKGRWIGGGDLRIGALMGSLVGWPYILLSLFLGYLTGAIYSLIGLAIGKFTRRSQIPFVPFLLLGTYLSMFWGEQMIDWYVSWVYF